jgi:mannan endo-1,4-beta-mannosidase
MRALRSAPLLCLSLFVFVSLAAAAPQPVNPHASPEARALLAYLDSISGKNIITGQHNYPNDGSRWTDLAYDLTGKYPGLFGKDFGFSGGEDKDSVLARPASVEEMKRQWANGDIIALTWHAVRPTDDEPVTFHDSVQGHLTDYEWHQLLTPGTPLYNRWCQQVDFIAGYLRALRDAHVPVLFRPYHEMSGNWFWWGYRPGPDGSAALYRQLYHRFVDVHHLDNLIWVWNVNAPGGAAGPVDDYYPGAQYVDVASIDIYGAFEQSFYDSMLKLAGGAGPDAKPIALAEVGNPPSLDVLATQPRWVYFMQWSGFMDSNRLDAVNAIYSAPQALNRNDPRLAEPLAAIRKATVERTGGKLAADPVTPDASAKTKALLARLFVAPGGSVLSAEAEPAPINTQTTGTAELPQPAIVAGDLDTTPAGLQALAVLTVDAQRLHTPVALTWRPNRPTDGGPAKSQLTDYEWNDLLTPGCDLNKRWIEQADAAAAALRKLQDAGIPVLFAPYPESNGKDSWWAGRTGVRGSAELYRMLFDRMVNHDGLHNLLWVWEIGPPSFGSAPAVLPGDFFPGLLYVDALELRTRQLNGRWPLSRFLTSIGVDKPIGVELTGAVPTPDALLGQSAWSWFVLDAAPATPTRAAALHSLFADPHIASQPAKRPRVQLPSRTPSSRFLVGARAGYLASRPGHIPPIPVIETIGTPYGHHA